MGCTASSASPGAEPTDMAMGGRTAPEESFERPKGRPRRPTYTGIARRKVFSSSRLDGDRGIKEPPKIPKTPSEHSQVRSALCEGTLLGALADYEIDELIDYMDIVSVRAGEECDLSGCLCVVLEGAVRTSSTAEVANSSDSLVKHFEPGSVFGQVGLFDDSAAVGGLHVLADRPTRICSLQGSAYRHGMEFSRQARIKANMKLLGSIPIFTKLSNTERLQISDSSEVRTYRVNDVIIREGEPGEHFYILRSGGAAVSRSVGSGAKPQRIDYKYPGDYFGEAALLEKCPRNATVVAAEAGTEALCVDKALFNKQLLGPLSEIMDRSESTIQQQMLVSVPLLSQLTAERRTKLIGCLELETFTEGAFVFKQGDIGDRLYIIKKGEVSVRTQKGNGHSTEIDHLVLGQYFGERALVNNDPRMASAQAIGRLECYSLTKKDFDLLSLHENVPWSRRWDMEDTRDVSQLKVLRSLGAGAFGTAWLAKHSQNGKEYALKSLDKHTVKRQNWTAVVMREKDILSTLSPHPCVITMHNAFQSKTQLFMLMDIATGGELFQVLERFKRFEPDHARFYCGCVVLAIGHLHKHGVIFRDLKPENLLLTGSGYLKLIDMGFAKQLGKGEKTYTLCGTPYYLAPEMILHRGHNFALDWWTVGVLTYEMLEGDPPFTGNSEMEVYGKVTRLQYTCAPSFPDLAVDLIERLLRREPENRLGNMRNGVNDVMAHPWFHGFSWDDLLDGKLQVPYLPPPQQTSSSSQSTKKPIDLNEVIKIPGSAGYWPGW